MTGDGRIEGFHLYRESQVESAAKGLGRLLGLLEQKRLSPYVAVKGNWKEIDAVAAQLIDRDFPGKAVLTI